MSALEHGYRVIGIRRGWMGLLQYNLDEPSTHDYYVRPLSRKMFAGLTELAVLFCQLPHQSAKGYRKATRIFYVIQNG